MSLTELIQKIHELSPEDQELVRRELDHLEQIDEEETPEMIAAVEEGLRSSREEGSIPFEDFLEQVREWKSTRSK